MTTTDIIDYFIDNVINKNTTRALSNSNTKLIDYTSAQIGGLGVFKKDSPSSILFMELSRANTALSQIVKDINSTNNQKSISDLSTKHADFISAATAYSNGINDEDLLPSSTGERNVENIISKVAPVKHALDVLTQEDVDAYRQELAYKKEMTDALRELTKNQNDTLKIGISGKFGDIMIGILNESDASSLKEKIATNVNKLHQKDRSSWTHADILLARCLACSTVALTEDGLNPFISELRTDYDLKFPNNDEYEANRKKYLNEITTGEALNEASAPPKSKINIIVCNENSKADVITATEQYIRKLTLSATEKKSPLIVKVVKNERELQDALDYCNKNNVSVHLTNISHGSSKCLGFQDLPEDSKTAALQYVNGVTNALDGFLPKIGIEDKELLALILDNLKDNFGNNSSNTSNQSLGGQFLDALRDLSAGLVKEETYIATLINDNSSIERVRLLACTSAGNSELLDEHTSTINLNQKKGYGERLVNQLRILNDDTKLSKVAAIAQQVTRDGVIIKGELGVLNPGVGGKLRYGSKKVDGGNLYKDDKTTQSQDQGTVRFITKNSSTPQDSESKLNTAEKYKEFKEQMRQRRLTNTEDETSNNQDNSEHVKPLGDKGASNPKPS